MKTYKTSDIGIAAFIMMKGLKLVEANRAKTGRFAFVFEDPGDVANSYAVDYLNSESAKFDANMKNLKNILFKS
jgi:hypothetical protein|tara:strand:+ start:620 stop:841 length:222 start_codon:yes stop_codon:yes gene_type:complete